MIFRDTPPESVVRLLDEFIVALPKDIIAAGLPAITASCGVSSDRIESGELKLRHADKAMYRAKQDGRGRVILSN
jgi:GGDEF domain-containing protein